MNIFVHISPAVEIKLAVGMYNKMGKYTPCTVSCMHMASPPERTIPTHSALVFLQCTEEVCQKSPTGITSVSAGNTHLETAVATKGRWSENNLLIFCSHCVISREVKAKGEQETRKIQRGKTRVFEIFPPAFLMEKLEIWGSTEENSSKENSSLNEML